MSSSNPREAAGSEGAVVARRLAAFGQELAGTLRRASVVDLLFKHVRDALAPTEISVALFNRDSEGGDFVHTWPAGLPDRRPILQLAAHGGPMAISGNLDAMLAQIGMAPHGDTSGSWCVAPFLAKRQVTGAIAARAPEGQLGPLALPLLEGLAAQASVALESARLVDLHDDGRRSWQEVVDAISLALCIVDRQGRIRRANRAFAELVDVPPATLIGRPWQAFVPPDWAPELTRAIEARGAGDEVALKTGERHFAVTAVPVTASDPTLVLLFDDQTERRQLHDQLIQSEKMSAVGQLIAGIAHDLNNPLASVVGFADFLGEVKDVPPALREPLNVIREEAERASNIVKNLLGFARKQERQRRPTALRPLLDATMILLRNQLLANRVEARVEMEDELPMVYVDPNQLQQVFVNLIHNASHAIASTDRPGTVLVRARRMHEAVAVEVADDGPGMSESLAAQVFEPFFTTKREGEGTGLGLSISQGIVREHGGRITLETAEGQGSTFIVELPLARYEPPVVPTAPLRTGTARLRVLVIDDEPHILHYMRATLEAWGHVVEVAADGEEGLALAADRSFDLIISDLRMPRVGGREFYQELVRRSPEAGARVYFSTGDTVRGDTLAFLEQLDRPYLHKPFSLAELRTLLASISRTGRESGSHRVEPW